MGLWRFSVAVHQQRNNARIAQFPERAVEEKMVDVYHRRKDQKARGEIEVKNSAHDPRTRNEQCDTARGQYQKIASHSPGAPGSGARFAALIVACNPDVLGRMQDSQNSAAIARLRNPVSGM